MPLIIARIISLIIGYVIGLFQTGYIYGKSQGIDIRNHGSGNSGTTNTLRTLGWKAGAITFIGDSFKAIITVIIVYLIFRCVYTNPTDSPVKLLMLYGGFGAVLGHNFPFYMKFKGGKGIACTAGVVLAVCPLAAPLCMILFVGAIVLTKYVSLGSILVVIAFLVQAVVFNVFGILNVGPSYVLEFDIVVACFTAMAIWRHRANIVRLLNGTENKIGKSKKE